MTVFTCEDTFEAMMSCIYTAWDSGLGHKNIRLAVEPYDMELFSTYRHVPADAALTAKVIRSIRQKISPAAYRIVYRCAVSAASDKLDIIYRFLLLGFSRGARVTEMFGNPYVANILSIDKKVGSETQSFREFLRFTAAKDGVLVAFIEPRSDIVSLLAPPFEDRMPSENWMIIDCNRRLALIHPADGESYMRTLAEAQYKQLRSLEDGADPFIDLWKTFFSHIAIKERANYRCQRNHMPLWYRKHATEFSDQRSSRR